MMHVRRGRWLVGCGVALVFFAVAVCLRSDRADDAKRTNRVAAAHAANPFPHRTKLADEFFAGGNGWLNVSGPIELRDLRGKIVLLDFWTYCCINCMHILPDLAYLEHKFPKDLVVIGVHSAKFDNEKDSENIRRAILRYDIAHPVVNDSRLAIWRRAGVNAWPTLALIDPEGKYVGSASGEGHRGALEEAIEKLIEYHKAVGDLDESPLRLGLERQKSAASPLKFPGKVLADAGSGRLFIADSNHNRIVVTTLTGQLLDVAGAGPIGLQDGTFAAATFHHPQGMALDGSRLYVADTENHLIRVLDLDKKSVSTLAGTGSQELGRSRGGELRQTQLNSPWDLAVADRTLYVAMAGAQQIWAHILGSDTIRPWAGTGREDVLNGTRDEAAFGQPSGLATDGEALFVADSEGSAIRKIPLAGAGLVSTLAGPSDLELGRTLFEFGDANGTGKSARFQHPLGLAYSAGKVFVADTYNHKIKIVNALKGESKTWLGSKRGDSLDPAAFSEPGGVSAAGGFLFIADTNNHVIKTADLTTRQVAVLTIAGLTPPAVRTGSADEPEDMAAAAAIKLEPQRVAAGNELRLEFSFKFPTGYELNKSAPARCRLRVREGAGLFEESALTKPLHVTAQGEKGVATVPLRARSGKAILDASLSFTYCRDGVGGLCKLGNAQWTVPIELSDKGGQTAVQLVAEPVSK